MSVFFIIFFTSQPDSKHPPFALTLQNIQIFLNSIFHYSVFKYSKSNIKYSNICSLPTSAHLLPIYFKIFKYSSIQILKYSIFTYSTIRYSMFKYLQPAYKRPPTALTLQCQICGAPAPDHLHFGGNVILCIFGGRAFFYFLLWIIQSCSLDKLTLLDMVFLTLTFLCYFRPLLLLL